MIVTINNYDHYGRGISKYNNKIIFVENALIGEQVEIEIIKEKKNYIEAKAVKYLSKSDSRCNNLCPYYNNCGGCNILHMNYDEQLKFKYNKIFNIVTKYIKEDIKINNIVASNQQFNYRNKVSLHEKNNIIGFYDKNSNNIIKIEKCLLLNNKLNDYLNKVDYNSLVLRTNGKEILNNYNDKIIFNIDNYKFNVSLESFFQINPDITTKLYRKIKEYANIKNNNIVYDLYCGTGTIGIYLANDAKKVYGIEINKKAINDANENANLNNINNIEFMCGDAAKLVFNIKDNPDIIVVDPPRAGLDATAINQIIKLNPIRIVYTSCDPMTLVRDLNILKEKYIIKEITPFDMFPNTYHVESVVLLEHK